MSKHTLPKNDQPNMRRQFHLDIPEDIWKRMVESGAARWGKTTKFILKAIEEKLDREEQKR